MTRITGPERGKRPKLTPESLGDLERAAVTVLKAGAFVRNGRRVFWLETETPADHMLFLSGADVRILAEELGDDTDLWAGRLVVVEKVVRRFNSKDFPKYQIAPVADWPEGVRT